MDWCGHWMVECEAVPTKIDKCANKTMIWTRVTLCHWDMADQSLPNNHNKTACILIGKLIMHACFALLCFLGSGAHSTKSLSAHNLNLVKSALQWRHNGHDGVLNHQPHHCLLYRLFRCRSKKTSKLRVTGLCGEFPAQMANNAEKVSIWWRHHEKLFRLER